MDDLVPEIRQRCLHCLRGICGRQALLPRSLGVPLCYDVTENPLCRGGLADVWKGQHHGRDVAAKVLKLRPGGDPGRIKRVGCRWRSRLVMCIIDSRRCLTEILQGGCWVEGPTSSKRTTVVRRDSDRESARDGVGVDEERSESVV